MRTLIGTSGYQYEFWRGGLYSERCKPADMLAEYAAKLPTVEINATFYRMPKTSVVERWAGQVPPDFRFALKASRRITHIQRLKDAGDSVRYLFEAARALGDKLGSVLFQLPPNLKKDVPRLQAFFETLPPGANAALEFRHESWFDDEVYALLRARGIALCISDEGEGERATPFVATAGFGYLRLRRETYDDAELTEFARKISQESWSVAYAYFKHEEGAPQLAARLAEKVSQVEKGPAV